MLGHYSLAEAPIAALAGLNVAVDVTGVAGTTSLGSESVATDQVLDVTGVAGTTSLGSESVAIDYVASVTGVAGTTGLGNESVATDQVLDVTGVVGTGVVPSVILWGEEGVGGDLPSATWIKIAA